MRTGPEAPPPGAPEMAPQKEDPGHLRSRHSPGVPDRDISPPTESRLEQARRDGNCDWREQAPPSMLFKVCG